jgi:hypothetical protein
VHRRASLELPCGNLQGFAAQAGLLHRQACDLLDLRCRRRIFRGFHLSLLGLINPASLSHLISSPAWELGRSGTNPSKVFVHTKCPRKHVGS